MAELKFDLNNFRLDPDAKLHGVWIDFGGGAEFKIAAFDNPEFTSAFRKATKPFNDLGQKPTDEDQAEIMCRTMSKYIVLDWKGVFEGKNELPFSIDAAYRVLNELEMIRGRVITEAQNLSNFKAKAREDTAGN